MLQAARALAGGTNEPLGVVLVAAVGTMYRSRNDTLVVKFEVAGEQLGAA
jgi:hypothetical protein